MSTAKFDTLQNAAGSKSVPVSTVVDGSAKAWVNFNGTGVVAIRAAFNCSSITDNGINDYTLNFPTPMADALYCVINTSTLWEVSTPQSSPNPLGTKLASASAYVTKTTSAVRIHNPFTSDFFDNNVAIFR